jgi:hypothetical protein
MEQTHSGYCTGLATTQQCPPLRLRLLAPTWAAMDSSSAPRSPTSRDTRTRASMARVPVRPRAPSGPGPSTTTTGCHRDLGLRLGWPRSPSATGPLSLTPVQLPTAVAKGRVHRRRRRPTTSRAAWWSFRRGFTRPAPTTAGASTRAAAVHTWPEISDPPPSGPARRSMVCTRSRPRLARAATWCGGVWDRGATAEGGVRPTTGSRSGGEGQPR